MTPCVTLVTGFPALRAAHIVRALLREARSDIVALVHPERLEEAQSLLEKWDLPQGRVSLVEGDAAAIDFGLDGANYVALASSIEVVHAAYSVTDVPVTEELAFAVNVGAARELVELSRVAKSLRQIALYSSVFVSGQRVGRVEEQELVAGQSFHGPVEQTLAIAERMLNKSGAPHIVLRAGHLLGDSEQGVVEHLAGPYWLIAFIASAVGEAALPLPPGAEALLALTPVDYLARFGAFAVNAAKPGATLHVIDPSQPSLRQFLELVAERCGRKLETGFNPSAFTRLFLGNPALRALPQQVRGIFEVLTSAAEYAMQGANELVAQGAPACPTLASYLDRLLEHVRQRNESGSLYSERRLSAPFLVS